MLPDNSLKKQEKCEHDVTRYRKQGASFTITVPKSLRESLHWQDGDILLVTAHMGTLVVLPAKGALINRVEEYVKATDHIN